MGFSSPVMVIGGGWAGLAAAIELVRHDIPVTLLESARQLGGRARRVPFAEANMRDNTNLNSINNGQHLILGSYDSSLTLLRTIGVHERDVFKRVNFSLHLLKSNKNAIKFKISNLPAPLHFAWGLLTTSGLSIKDRLTGLKFGKAMSRIDFDITQDETCIALLKRHRQSDRIIQAIWEPLCQAILNTKITDASARVFLRIVRELFSHTQSNSDILLPTRNLGAILPEPAMDFIERNGGSVQLAQQVTSIQITDNAIRGIKIGNQFLDTRHVILATPHQTCAKLLAPHQALSELIHKIQTLENNPVCTVYIQYPPKTKLNKLMIGLVESTAQWIFDRRICGQPGLMAVVIGGQGQHFSLDNASLCDKITAELASLFPRWPKPEYCKVIREKHATFKCSMDVNTNRPPNKTPINGLWLAGDYTDTNLPPTLESAVRSGLRSARGLIASQG